MHYTVLCYHDEDITTAWSREEEAVVVDRLIAVHDKSGRTFRPVVRRMPTNTATSVRKSGTLVTDGPFAETKEQLLGIYVIEVRDPIDLGFLYNRAFEDPDGHVLELAWMDMKAAMPAADTVPA